MKRRTVLSLFGLAVCPAAAQTTADRGTRRIAVLLGVEPTDSEYPNLVSALVQGLRDLGWVEGRNIEIELRWSDSAGAIRRHLAEIAARPPNLVVAAGNSTAGPLLQATRDVPVVFTIVPDPVGAGFVENLAKPGGNATGFVSFEYGVGAKWLEVLKEVAPKVTRVAVLRDPSITAGVGQWNAIQTAAPSFGVDVTPINLGDTNDFERAIAGFAKAGARGGVIVTSSGPAIRHRESIVRAAADHQLAALYYAKAFVTAGGLISYGSDRIDQFRRAASYVDRILKGERPADLPVQGPTKYELAVNLRAARALGLTVPSSLLARADEVIE